MRKQKGFTLIELLVVIAIIGILAAIVLVSLSGARDRAKDARIRSDLGQIRSIAELVYNDSSPMSYNALCSSNNDYNTLASDINNQVGSTPTCVANGDAYCVSSALASGGSVCVNDAGSVVNNATCGNDTSCD